MLKVKSSKKALPVAVLFIIAVLGLVQIAGAWPMAERNSSQDPTLCKLTVAVLGNGEIDALAAGHESMSLTAQSSELQVSCAQAIELTARPDSLNRFVRWEGVPASVASKYRITVSAGTSVTAVFAPRKILRYETLDTPFVDRTGKLVSELPIYESVWRDLSSTDSDQAETTLPEIDVWYGDSQTFGSPGIPQVFANILGNVFDVDGDLSKLEYKINGNGPYLLNVGGDGHKGDGLRLYNEGDFNVDLPFASLNSGSNTLLLIATDSLGGMTERTVQVVFDDGNNWPLPYSTNWVGASTLQSEAQIVDGKWGKTTGGVTPIETGYDRTFAIGDMNLWSDYEATVPVTINGYSDDGFKQNAPALGIVLRWKGHTTNPPLCDQPLCGYNSNGAVAWYEFQSKGSEIGQFSMWSIYNYMPNEDTSGTSITWGETYLWKVRSQTLAGTKGIYSMKLWNPSKESEPTDWLLTFQGNGANYEAGSMLLVSHHVNVVFGDVVVEPFDPAEGPPVISVDRIVPEPHGATVSWVTDEPTTGRVDFGEDSNYGSSIPADELSTQHSVYIPGLQADHDYHLRIWAKDSSNETATTGDKPFHTQEVVQLVSDDFNTCTLNSGWEFVDPLGDGSYEVNGSEALISVPAGANHDIWPPGPPVNRAPRLMQQVTDPNNLKVKFDSGIADEIGQQGIILEEDENNFLRINYQFEGGHMKLVVVGFKSGAQPAILRNLNLNGASPDGPFYLGLKRTNGMWQLEYSTDDQDWTAVDPFSFPLSVAKAGFYAGNANKTPGNEPAFTTAVDYWFDANAPIDPEDGNALQLPVTVVGNGTVNSDPTCGNPVTLTAEAAPGWHFVEWQGSPIDGLISLQVVAEYEVGDEVAAFFAEGEPETYTLDVQTGSGEGTAIVTPDKSEYTRGEVVRIEADPADGWSFDSWGGDLSGTDPVQQLLMDGDKEVVANFTRSEFNVEVTVVGPGQVQLSPPGPYAYDQAVTLNAVPAVGSLATFVGWSGDVSSSDNPLEINVTDDMAITATFIVHTQFLPFAISQSGP